MRTQAIIFAAICAGFFSTNSSRAELPPEIKPTADQYDQAMATYDKNIALQIKVARDSYVTVLNAVRKREAGARRDKSVAAIDAELKAMEAGPLPEAAPADLPADAARYREQYTTAPARAAKAVESARNFTRANYLKWLNGMGDVARKVKNADLEAAVNSEIKRVSESDTEVNEDDPESDE